MVRNFVAYYEDCIRSIRIKPIRQPCGGCFMSVWLNLLGARFFWPSIQAPRPTQTPVICVPSLSPGLKWPERGDYQPSLLVPVCEFFGPTFPPPLCDLPCTPWGDLNLILVQNILCFLFVYFKMSFVLYNVKPLTVTLRAARKLPLL